MKLCLVVDDSRVIRRVAAKIVQDLGFDVEEAEDGRKALNACAIRLRAVMLVASDMPEIRGSVNVQARRSRGGGDKGGGGFGDGGGWRVGGGLGGE